MKEDILKNKDQPLKQKDSTITSLSEQNKELHESFNSL